MAEESTGSEQASADTPLPQGHTVEGFAELMDARVRQARQVVMHLQEILLPDAGERGDGKGDGMVKIGWDELKHLTWADLASVGVAAHCDVGIGQALVSLRNTEQIVLGLRDVAGAIRELTAEVRGLACARTPRNTEPQ